jgi:DNA-binding NarL/FixJ family response regulator
VTVVSSRPAVLAAWMARLAGQGGLRVTGAVVPDAQALHSSLAQSPPHVLLLDVAALEWLHREAMRVLLPEHSELRVLLVCDSAGPGLIEIVLRNRFAGYLLADERPDFLVKAILSVQQGQLWLPRDGLAAALYTRVRDRLPEPVVESAPSTPKPRAPLTERERQVADCLRKGLSNSKIAGELGIKKDTVKKHLRSVFGKLGVRRRSEVAAIDEAASTGRSLPGETDRQPSLA